MVVLHVRDAGGGWVAQKWQFQRDVIIEQPQIRKLTLQNAEV